MRENKLQELKSNIHLLIDNIDPQSKISFENDSILTSKFNKNLLREVSELIDLMIRINADPGRIDNRLKNNFYIPQDVRDKIPLSESPIPVSTFTYTLNEQIDTVVVKKLQATQITSWLYKQGYLSEIEHEDGKRFKVLTKKSPSIGLSSREMTNSFGRQYSVILYNTVAQKYIIDNLDQIICS